MNKVIDDLNKINLPEDSGCDGTSPDPHHIFVVNVGSQEQQVKQRQKRLLKYIPSECLVDFILSDNACQCS